MISFDPSRVDLTPYGFSCRRWTPAVMRRPDRHNEVELNFLSSGWLTYLFGGKVRRAEAARWTAFWAAVPHQIVDHGDQREYFVVTIPLGYFLGLRLPDHFVQALVRGEIISIEPDCSADLTMQRLADWESDFASATETDYRATLLEIEAQVRRISVGYGGMEAAPETPGKRHRVLHDGAFAKAEQIAQLVAARYMDQMDALEICRLVDPHPKRAMKLFQVAFGTPLADFLTEYRISQAQRLLVSTSMRIIDVSEMCGFGSLGHFNRAFRHACGCPPREFRKRNTVLAQ